MASPGTRSAAALSVVLSAALGYATNLLTNHWSWGLAAGSLALLAALVWLAVRTSPTPAPPPRTSVQITARDGSHITGNTTEAADGAHVAATADHHGTIKDTTARATGADLTMTADNATIQDGETTAH